MEKLNNYEKFCINQMHLDRDDEIFAADHHGYYLMSYPTKSTNDGANKRLYFSFEEKKEYYDVKVKKGFYKYKTCTKSKYILFDKNTSKEEKEKILELIYILFYNQKLTIIKTQNLLSGLNVLLKYLKLNSVEWNSIDCFQSDVQYFAYKLCENKTTRRNLSEFFTFLSLKSKNFVKKNHQAKLLRSYSNAVESLPSIVYYQLVEFSKKELEESFSKLEEYRTWIKDKENFLTQKNILKTLINEYTNTSVRNNVYKDILKLSLDSEHLEMLEPFELKLEKLRSMGKVSRDKNNKNKEKILEYLRESDVLPKDMKFYCIWIKTVEKDYPYDTTIKNEYFKLSETIAYRAQLAGIFKINTNEISKMSTVTIHLSYPLFLLTQLESGKNNEVLYDWKVNKLENGMYSIGNRKTMCLSIEGYKNRGNSGTSTTLISYDAPLMKYINLYLKYASEVYDKSKSNHFFQYYNAYSGKASGFVNFCKETILNYKALDSNMYKKFDIRDNSNQRVSGISHQSIRKAFNYQMYLQGKSAFERQLKNEHKNVRTTIEHYETDYNWLEDKRIRLGDALLNVMDNIFNGEIKKKEVETIAKGVISDCKNNLEPNYIGFSKLKKGHLCSDWKKCLTKCSKSIVITKIHGPAIMAWRDYLLELYEELPYTNYTKEGYVYDLAAAEKVLEYFSDEELEFAEEHKSKYYNLVRIQLPISYKIPKKVS